MRESTEKTTHDEQHAKRIISYVIMFLTRVQFAWVSSPSETENFRQTLVCKCTKFDFNQWFVGFTDGDGCFNVYTNLNNLKLNFTFKISQKINNLQALYFMKNILGVGVVRKDKIGMAHFLIRNKEIIKKVVIPLFDQNTLLTSKEFSYLKFKQCIEISNDSTLTQEQKILLINKIRSTPISDTFVSSIWYKTNFPITKDWLIGFVEAEGSFYITNKGDNRYVHGFGITQKRDKILLEGIINHLGINSKVRYNKRGFYIFDVLDSNSLKLIKLYFFNTMKGVKSLDYRIWARSFRDKGNNDKLLKIQKLLQTVRKDSLNFDIYESD